MSQVEERGLDALKVAVKIMTSEIVDNFLEDLEDLLSERDAGDLDDPVVVVGVGGFVLVFALVFLTREGSRGESLTTSSVGCHTNGTQARIDSRSCGRRSARLRVEAAALNLCCQIPSKDWVDNPLSIVQNTAHVVVQVAVAVCCQLDIEQIYLQGLVVLTPSQSGVSTTNP